MLFKKEKLLMKNTNRSPLVFNFFVASFFLNMENVRRRLLLQYNNRKHVGKGYIIRLFYTLLML